MPAAACLAIGFLAGFAGATDLADLPMVLGADAFFEGVRLSLFNDALTVGFEGDLAGLETAFATLAAFGGAFPLALMGFFEFAFVLEAPFSSFGRIATPDWDFPLFLTVA